MLENVLIPTVAQPHGNASHNTAALVERAKMLIDRVGLSNRLEHRPAELSGGERQRVAVARALIRKPILLLADEPTGNLDRTTAASVGQLLLELQRDEQMMLIVVTHSLELAAQFERRLELDDGKLIPHAVNSGRRLIGIKTNGWPCFSFFQAGVARPESAKGVLWLGGRGRGRRAPGILKPAKLSGNGFEKLAILRCIKAT